MEEDDFQDLMARVMAHGLSCRFLFKERLTEEELDDVIHVLRTHHCDNESCVLDSIYRVAVVVKAFNKAFDQAATGKNPLAELIEWLNGFNREEAVEFLQQMLSDG